MLLRGPKIKSSKLRLNKLLRACVNNETSVIGFCLDVAIEVQDNKHDGGAEGVEYSTCT